MSDKPAFDPSQAYDTVDEDKPAFDPTKPYDPAEDDIASTIKEQKSNPDVAKALMHAMAAPSQTVQALLGKAYQTAVPANKLAGDNEIVNNQDLKNALTGQGPEFSDYLERAGGPKLAGAKKLLTDMAAGAVTDPLSYLGMLTRGARGAAKVADLALNPGAHIAEHAAYPIYRGGLAKADEAAVRQGSELLPSKVLFDEGIWGRPKTLRKGAQDISKDLLDQRSKLYSKMSPIDTNTINYNDSIRSLVDFLRHPKTETAANSELPIIQKLSQRGSLSPEELSRSKSILQNFADYSPDPNLNPQAISSKLAATAEKQALESAADKAVPGGGKELSDTNEKLGALLGARNPFATMETIAARKASHLPTVVDFMYGPGMAIGSGSPEKGVWATVIKKLGDLSRTASARTGTGIALKKLSKSSLPDIVGRNLWNSMINQNQQSGEQ